MPAAIARRNAALKPAGTRLSQRLPRRFLSYAVDQPATINPTVMGKPRAKDMAKPNRVVVTQAAAAATRIEIQRFLRVRSSSNAYPSPFECSSRQAHLLLGASRNICRPGAA